MFCQPPVHISTLPNSRDRRPEKGRHDISIQDGRIHEEYAARERAIYGHDAANSRSIFPPVFNQIYANIDLGFNEFIHERESTRPDDPTIKFFDEVILAKRNRGKSSFFHKSRVDFLSDTSDHLWRSAAANPPNSRFPGDYRSVISRSNFPPLPSKIISANDDAVPAKLDPTLMKEPRVIQGVPRIPLAKARRKPIPSMLGPKSNDHPKTPPS
jgi:hypothetical protein